MRREREGAVAYDAPAWPVCGVGWVRWLGEEPSRKRRERSKWLWGLVAFVRGFVPYFGAAAVRAVGEIQ
jgi:hypothetical protein